MKDKLRLNRLGRLLTYTKRWKFLYWIGLLGNAGEQFVFSYISAFGFKGLSDASIGKNMTGMFQSLFYISVGFGLMMLIMPFFGFAFESTVKKITGLIRRDLFDHIQRMPLKYIENQHSGDLISRLTNDVQTAENAYGGNLLMILMAVIAGIGSILMIFQLNWKLAVIALLLGGANVLINTLFVKPLQKTSDAAQKALSDATQKLTDILAGSQVIRIFNLVHKMVEQYQNAIVGIRIWSMKRVVLNSYLNSITNFVSFMSFVGMIIIGGIMVVNKEITFGVLIAVIQFMNAIIWMFSSLGSFITQLQGSLAGAERIFEILDIPYENLEDSINVTEKVESDKLNPLKSQKAKIVIEFRNVNFSYESDLPILVDFNASIGEDHVIAVVGSSGSGKSTLFKLLLGFYFPDSGNIQIFGKSFSEYRLADLRKMISYVPQDNYLFSGTIEENIRYGWPDSIPEKIIDAAKEAYAHDFIMEFPDGYKTQVGERGAHLSGGQRQRIAIARALLKNAPILLLDEATSSLDSESEEQVQQALEVLMKGRTTMVVAHRISTIQNADRILVLENGKIVEEGNHATLLQLANRYAKLYNLQFRDVGSQVDPA